MKKEFISRAKQHCFPVIVAIANISMVANIFALTIPGTVIHSQESAELQMQVDKVKGVRSVAERDDDSSAPASSHNDSVLQSDDSPSYNDVMIDPRIPEDQIDPTIRAQLIGVQQLIGETESGAFTGFSEQSSFLQAKVGVEFENGTLPIQRGEYFFVGVGNWNQGHGLGFSQYGARGGAEAGMTATQIAKHYYAGSYIGTTSNSNITIEYCRDSSGNPVYSLRPPCPQGYTYKAKTMKIETYLAGLGEIPDKACGTAAQAAAHPEKYRVPNGNEWYCWPEAAIKAQIIVSRSYAKNWGTICTSAACQVYKGGTAKQWAAQETAGKVLKSSGAIITAYFSSDNNNGWGSGTHQKPMWCGSYDGDCDEGYSWLQSVYDEDFADGGPYEDFYYRSNGYKLANFDQMLLWYSNNGRESGLRSYASTVRSTIGSLTKFTMRRDNSCRVHKVRLDGTSGSIFFNGDKFTGMYNEWVMRTDPSGQHDANGNYDFISSLTYYIVKAPRNITQSTLSFVDFNYTNCSVTLDQPVEGDYLPI